MSGWNYYLLSNIPGLPALGAVPPCSVSEYLDAIGINTRARLICESLALGEDLISRAAVLSGEKQSEDSILEFLVLKPDLQSGVVPLPDTLKDYLPELEAESGANQTEQLFFAYFRYLFDLGKSFRSSFLQAWSGHEVALRNALSSARAGKSGRTFEALEFNEVDQVEYDFSDLLAGWEQALTPLDGLKLVEQQRWNWLVKNENWFTFSDDELAVYGAKLLSLWRWYRLVKAEGAGGRITAKSAA